MKYAIFSMGHSYMLVDIDCLSLDSPFYADLTPDDPLFSSVHTQWPPFFHFCEEFYVHIRDFRGGGALRAFRENYRFHCNFNKKFENFGLKLHWMNPVFGVHFKTHPIFFSFEPTPYNPFFHVILHRLPSTSVLRKAHRRHFHIRVPRPCPPPPHIN